MTEIIRNPVRIRKLGKGTTGTDRDGHRWLRISGGWACEEGKFAESPAGCLPFTVDTPSTESNGGPMTFPSTEEIAEELVKHDWSEYEYGCTCGAHPTDMNMHRAGVVRALFEKAGESA